MQEDLFSCFDNINSDTIEWWQEPLSFRAFVESKEHLNLRLTDVQYGWFEKLIGDDPTKVFRRSTQKHIMAILAGKGSGKDLCTSAFLDWVLYLLLCMENPTEYFNLVGAEEKIDIVNVAQNQSQSIRVFFKRFTDRLKRWPWLKKNFLLNDHKKILNPEVTNPRDTINILDASLTLDASPVRFWSLHSGSQSYEGFNILVFVIDEGSAFSNYYMYDKDGKEIVRSRADDMLAVLKSSAESRNWQWYGFLISYPRSRDCFQMRKYKEGQLPDSDIMSVRNTQFESLPASKYSGKWVEWQGYMIPEERLKSANEDPADFKLKYLCVAEEFVRKYFDPMTVKPVFKSSLDFIATTVDTIRTSPTGVKYLYKEITNWKQFEQKEYVLVGDYSSVSDRTSVLVAHAEDISEEQVELTGFKKRMVIDLILVWQPDKKNKVLVSHASIINCIKDILYTLNVVYASLDQLESAYTLESINMQGIMAEKHNVNDADYARLKALLGVSLVDCPIFLLLEFEFNNVEYFPKRHRVDHTSDGSKDVLDTVCQAARILYTKEIRGSVHIEVGDNPWFLAEQEQESSSIDDWSSILNVVSI